MKHIKTISRTPAKAQITSVFQIKAEFILGVAQRASEFLFQIFVA